MTKRRIELTSLQIKTIEVALMDYVSDQYRTVDEHTNITQSYLYQRGLYLHFLFQEAEEVTLDIEDPHDTPRLVQPHLVYNTSKPK